MASGVYSSFANYSGNYVAFVAKTGNDTGAIIGNPGKPFLTINAAITALEALTPTSTNRAVVEVSDGGNYVESVLLKNYIDLFLGNCTITSVSNPCIYDTTGVDCKIFGKANLINTTDNIVCITFNTNSTIEFELGDIYTSTSAATAGIVLQGNIIGRVNSIFCDAATGSSNACIKLLDGTSSIKVGNLTTGNDTVSKLIYVSAGTLNLEVSNGIGSYIGASGAVVATSGGKLNIKNSYLENTGSGTNAMIDVSNAELQILNSHIESKGPSERTIETTGTSSFKVVGSILKSALYAIYYDSSGKGVIQGTSIKGSILQTGAATELNVQVDVEGSVGAPAISILAGNFNFTGTVKDSGVFSGNLVSFNTSGKVNFKGFVSNLTSAAGNVAIHFGNGMSGIALIEGNFETDLTGSSLGVVKIDSVSGLVIFKNCRFDHLYSGGATVGIWFSQLVAKHNIIFRNCEIKTNHASSKSFNAVGAFTNVHCYQVKTNKDWDTANVLIFGDGVEVNSNMK